MKNSTPTFDEWLNKYFEQPEKTITYKDKRNNNRITIDDLKKKYIKAYKINDLYCSYQKNN